MRIIAGSLRGRRLKAPKGTTTRPTTDRVRESLFSALTSLAGADLGGGAVLDPFAGSGALGLEALSRGASSATFIERDRAALAALRANVADLGVADSTRIIQADAFSLARRGVAGGPFALLLLDPPYTLDPTDVAGMLSALGQAGSISQGSYCTWEHATDVEPAWPTGFEIVQRKTYGSTQIDFAIYKRGAGEK